MLIQLLKLSQDSDHVPNILVSSLVNDGFNGFLLTFLMLPPFIDNLLPKTWTDFRVIIAAPSLGISSIGYGSST